jgi:hypothetical protein
MSVVKRVVVLLGVVGLLLGLAPASRAATSGRRLRTVSLAGARIDDDGWFFYPQSCGPTQPGLCTFKGSGIAHWSGVVAGISEYQVFMHWDQNKQVIVDETWERFTVTIAGCGQGSFLTHQRKEYTLAEVLLLQDPATGKVQGGEGTWEYVPGTATSGLANMRSFWVTIDHVQFDPITFENHITVDKGAAVC